MKYLLLICSCLFTQSLLAQSGDHSRFSKELFFTTDNDAYLFHEKDQYYTNGVFLKLATAGERNHHKHIHNYELGQMIYTPFLRTTTNPADIDRPYCGFLYARELTSVFLDDDALLQWSATIGVTGRISLGEQLQNSYHRFFNYGRFAGWQYQVQDGMGIDAGFTYARTLVRDASWIKLVPVVQASLGTSFTYAKLGSYLCMGAFESNSNSALWNARIDKHQQAFRRKHELFVYYYPQLVWQGYNATIQGELLGKDDGTSVLGEPERIMLQQNFGVCYARARFTTRLEFIIQSKEAVAQKMQQEYGSIQVSYRLH